MRNYFLILSSDCAKVKISQIARKMTKNIQKDPAVQNENRFYSRLNFLRCQTVVMIDERYQLQRYLLFRSQVRDLM